MRFVWLVFIFSLTACSLSPDGVKDRADFDRVSFSDLNGWENDTLSDALKAFRLSCPALKSKPVWIDVCNDALRVPPTDGNARAFFETNFQPYAVSGRNGSHGLFTGYYVPELLGSLTREGKFQTPLYRRPADLVSVDLGLFKADLKGLRIAGKVDNGKLVPYEARNKIVTGALDLRTEPIAWVNDPVGAFFLGIQGSGRVRLTDGNLIYIGYDGTNGHPYSSIGRLLADKNILDRPVTMASIRQKLETSSLDRAQEIMNWNASYIFYRVLPQNSVVGAQGVSLTPRRSLAVDPAYLPLGAPVWLETTDGKGMDLRRLVVAQDTGGAIKGVVRGDFFWGPGDEAETQAGSMQNDGRYFVLFPKEFDPNGN